MALKLDLDVISVTLYDLLIDLKVASIHSILDGPHLLFGFRKALEVKVCSVLLEQVQSLHAAGAYGKEDRADSFIITLLINVYLLLPSYRLIKLSEHQFLLLLLGLLLQLVRSLYRFLL